MPRTPLQGAAFIVGLWLALTLLSPLAVRGAESSDDASDAELRLMERDLHGAVNEFRRAHELIALERDPALDSVARRHSTDMATRRYLSHKTPEGANWVDRLERAGVRGFTMAGENVGQTNRRPPNTEILEGWKHSPVHRQNLAARPFNRTGLGIARAADGTLYYTQLYLTFPR